VFDWMVTHARIAPDHAALAQPSPASDLDPLNLAPHAEAFNEAPDEALRPEQAEAERSALWAVHAQGPDELYAAFSREDAEKHAAELNALPMPEGIAVGAVVVPSPWPAVQHWQYLAEQEQDHKNEIAGRLRQHERIGEALRAEITQLRQHKNDYMDAGQETYRALQNEIREREAEIARLDGLVSGHTAERDAALARVAELEAKLSDPTAVHQWQFSNAWFDGSEEVVLKAGKEGSPIRTLYAAPVAQAQRSVPEEFSFEYRHPNGECHTVTVSREQVINEMPDFLFEALCSKFCNCEPVGETNVVECRCDEYAEEFKLIAAAPGKEGV
ncbi:TPA: hypothetical protein R1R58_006598, partial [Pseudomonas aeruginosa]|nr:hypothetical protein [Pseudomonas aeruginosa]HEC0895834.1 hypothetical protein [Pseudomonas aeruginosa]